jgi:hypothetical protein
MADWGVRKTCHTGLTILQEDLPMLKKLTLVWATAGLLLVGAAPQAISAAEYKHSGCADAAKAEFPDDHAARKDFKHWCKDQWKLYKKSHKD